MSLSKIEEILKPEKVDTRRIYNLVVSFHAPQQATITLAAKDKDHAAALATEQLEQTGYTNHKVHDIYLMEDIYKRDREIMEKMKTMYDEAMVVDGTAKEIVN